MVATVPMAPDERVFREHLNGARFQDGVERGRWRLVGDIDWPHVVVAVSAAQRENAPDEFFLKVDATGYPQSAPTFIPWDPATGGLLQTDRRPKGDLVGYVFRSDWENGAALYAPFDRVALCSHPDWIQRHPHRTWHPKRDFAWVLNCLHEMLNDADYTGV